MCLTTCVIVNLLTVVINAWLLYRQYQLWAKEGTPSASPNNERKENFLSCRMCRFGYQCGLDLGSEECFAKQQRKPSSIS